jgi:UDP-glucose:(heptosyl)LPS alpha-1,3-glucosyltransferase
LLTGVQLVFTLYKYFPFGGLQRNFLQIARACQARGHLIRVYVLEWNGDMPVDFEIIKVPVKAMSNHRRYARFTDWVQQDLRRHPADRVIGFNKMPGLDVYYAADPCYVEKVRTQRHPLYRLLPRYRHFTAYEKAVFATSSKTRILMLSSLQMPIFLKHYGTPTHRIHILPPGISPDRRAPPDAPARRQAFRAEFQLADDDFLLVQIGSGFRTKGLDRSLKALAALPPELRRRTRLIAIGEDNPKPFIRQARLLGLESRFTILPGRDDIPRFLLGADLLIHPAYSENTGNVLLEALVAGLPVLTTDACGYAHYVVDADAGKVVTSPFAQADLDTKLAHMLSDADARGHWQANGLRFAAEADIYSRAARAVDVILGDHP